MERKKIKSFQDILEFIDDRDIIGYDINLYRGQPANDPLLPRIARRNQKMDTTKIEKEMLAELKRRSVFTINKEFKTDWEWMVYGQHFGLKTRLLDWTSNPLVGLWFACSNENTIKKNGYLYVLCADNEMLLNESENVQPFEISATKVLKPSLNNNRIIAQSGWFTAHRYSKLSKQFITLESNNKIKNLLTEIEIPADKKQEILQKLSIFDVGYRTLFPDVTGLCTDINWGFRGKI